MPPTAPTENTLVSCLMVTRPDRFALMARSIAAFAHQTYGPRELVIVSSAETAAERRRIADHLSSLGRPDIRLVLIPPETTLGAARNRGVAAAHGRYVCQWDDDDLHHPERIACQMAAMRRAGRRACYLQDVFHYAEDAKALYWGHWGSSAGGVHPGTLLAEAGAVPPYPEEGPDARLGEDLVVLDALWHGGGFHALADQPHLFVYVAHGGNSWSAAHHRMLVDRLALPSAALRRREQDIRRGLRGLPLPPEVAVRGSDGLAFVLSDEGPRPVVGDGAGRRAGARSLPTILYAQEFGGNLGHVRRLVAVAKALGPARSIFAVPQAEVASPTIAGALGPEVEIVGGMGFRAPGLARSKSSGDSTLADVFHHLGYGHLDSLDQAADRWRTLIDRVAPDLIVCDFAPTIRLASWDRIPMVAMGSSYETPPPGAHLRTVVPPGQPPGAESLRREAHLLETAQAVRRRLGGPPLGHFADLFQGERTFSTAPPGCDPYAAIRADTAFPPFPVRDVTCGPVFAARTGPDIFCFLWQDHPWLDLILTALNGLPRRSEIHIRGIDPQLLVPQCAPQVGIRPQSADFAALLPQTRAFLHYGGAAASYWGLLAGTVQIIVPIHLEQEMTARGMVEHGGAVGLAIDKTATAARLREVIASVLDNTMLQQGALAAAQRARAGRTIEALPEIVAACRRLCRFPSETGTRPLQGYGVAPS